MAERKMDPLKMVFLPTRFQFAAILVLLKGNGYQDAS